MTKPIFGVNFGGWLIAEPWITPELFADTSCRDEFCLSQTEVGRQRIASHHRQFIAEEDFKWLKDHRVEAVRIPFGWWLFGDFAPWVGHVERLDLALMMAEKYDLKVLLDLHGLPGSQNGKDHSGLTDQASWLNSASLNLAENILIKVARRYQSSPAFWGLEIANEPKITFFNRHWILKFYHRIYSQLQPILTQQKIVFSDGYETQFFDGRLPNGAVLDKHHYQCFARRDRQLSFEQQVERAQSHQLEFQQLAKNQPIVIGEWSLGLDQRPEVDDWRQKYFTAQKEAMASAEAIFFWNYKIDNVDYRDWDFRWLVEQKMISF